VSRSIRSDLGVYTGLLMRHAGEALMTFDYTTPAELFMAKRKGGSRQQLAYRRFASAAEAIRFAVEEFPPVHTLGVWLQVGDERFNSHDIQRLYENDDYPLQRESAP
jgi:hypothetical protein